MVIILIQNKLRKEFSMSKRAKIKIVAIIFTLLATVGLIWFMFSGDNRIIIKQLFSADLSQEEFVELVRSFDIRGVITLSLLSMIQVIIPFMPEEPVQVLTGMGYGIWQGILICLAGIVLGNAIIYLACKIFGKSKVESMHNKNVEVDFEKIRTSKKVVIIILLLYILPAVPLGLICIFACSLDLKYPRYFLITTIGSIPSVFVGVALGHMTTTNWVLSLCVFIVIVILITIFAINKKKFYKKFNEYVSKSQRGLNEVIVKKPNPILYFLVRIGFFFYRKSKVKLVKKNIEKIKGPAIVLCNHGSFVDFLYAYAVLVNQKPNIMMARLYYYRKDLARLLKNLGAFPKSMFTSDVENAKNCLKVLNNGKVLIMMPEARLSTVGKFEDIQGATHKFFKKVCVPIYALKINGGYFAYPKWGDGWRKNSTVEVSLEQIVGEQEIIDISEQDIKEKIENAMQYNEFEWLKTRPELKYNHKTLARGLENILYICPNCKKEHTIVSGDNYLVCTSCGLRANLDNRYSFVQSVPFENFAEWYDYQKQVLKQKIENDENYVLESKVTLKLPSVDGKTFMRVAGRGTCTLDRKGLTYKGSLDGEQIEKFFPIKSIYRLLFGAGEDFEVYENKVLWYFVPENKKTCVTYYNASEILYRLANE